MQKLELLYHILGNQKDGSVEIEIEDGLSGTCIVRISIPAQDFEVAAILDSVGDFFEDRELTADQAKAIDAASTRKPAKVRTRDLPPRGVSNSIQLYQCQCCMESYASDGFKVLGKTYCHDCEAMSPEEQERWHLHMHDAPNYCKKCKSASRNLN